MVEPGRGEADLHSFPPAVLRQLRRASFDRRRAIPPAPLSVGQAGGFGSGFPNHSSTMPAGLFPSHGGVLGCHPRRPHRSPLGFHGGGAGELLCSPLPYLSHARVGASPLRGLGRVHFSRWLHHTTSPSFGGPSRLSVVGFWVAALLALPVLGFSGALFLSQFP